MQINTIIKRLENLKKKGETDVLVAWWEHGMFPEIKKEEWPQFAEMAEDQMDWSSDHEAITEIAVDFNEED